MFEAIQHPVLKLKRVAIGPLRDESLKTGKYRFLTAQEIRAFLKLAEKK